MAIAVTHGSMTGRSMTQDDAWALAKQLSVDFESVDALTSYIETKGWWLGMTHDGNWAVLDKSGKVILARTERSRDWC